MQIAEIEMVFLLYLPGLHFFMGATSGLARGMSSKSKSSSTVTVRSALSEKKLHHKQAVKISVLL